MFPKLDNVTGAPCEKSAATCPVCSGRGHHYYGFYLDEPGNQHLNAAGPNTTRCRTCQGSGVVRV